MDTEVVHSLSDRRRDRLSVMVVLFLMDWGCYHGSGLWLKLLMRSWVCVSGQVEYLRATDNTVEVRETFVGKFGLVSTSGYVTSVENREQMAISDDNILELHWGASDSAKPQLAQKVAALSNRGGFGSIYTSGQVTGSPQTWLFLIHLTMFSDCGQEMLSENSHFNSQSQEKTASHMSPSGLRQ